MTVNMNVLREWVGKTQEAEDIVTPRLVAAFRATFAPHLAPTAEKEAPLALHWCLAPQAASSTELGIDGHPTKGGFLPPIPLPRRMWAGGEVEFLSPLSTGDTIVRRSTIGGIRMKDGRTGELCFVEVHHEYLRGHVVCIRERQDIGFRHAASAAQKQSPAAPSARADRFNADTSWTVDASAVRLFRYSALTFNGHRIHYDLPYAKNAEGYDGLVVHGPLQASLLLNLAATMAKRPPKRFRYRGIAPLLAGQNFEVCGRHEHSRELTLWAAGSSASITMQATAE